MKADQTSWHDVGPLELLEPNGVLTARIGGQEAASSTRRMVRGRSGIAAPTRVVRSVEGRSRCVWKGHAATTTREIASCSAAPGMAGSSTCTQAPARRRSVRVAVYPVRVESGRVLVTTRPSATNQLIATPQGGL
jgi:hypothetical protein